MILINATLLVVHLNIMSKFFLSLFYVYVCVLCELFFFIDNVVNMCACHVYFTINLLTYLLRKLVGCSTSPPV